MKIEEINIILKRFRGFPKDILKVGLKGNGSGLIKDKNKAIVENGNLFGYKIEDIEYLNILNVSKK